MDVLFYEHFGSICSVVGGYDCDVKIGSKIVDGNLQRVCGSAFREICNGLLQHVAVKLRHKHEFVIAEILAFVVAVIARISLHRVFRHIYAQYLVPKNAVVGATVTLIIDFKADKRII